MTETEKILYARTYVDKLARGINPLTDQMIPESDVIHHVRISRCLFYVSDLLRQMAEEKNISEKKTDPEKVPFRIAEAVRKNFVFSDEPIPASEIAKRVNALIQPEEEVKLNYRHISDWLVKNGFLKETAGPDGRVSRKPTPEGMELGIFVEQRQGKNGMYPVTVYRKSAQHCIIDHLDAVIRTGENSRKEKEEAALRGQPWTQAQDETLTDLFRQNVPVSEIAVRMKRSRNGVKARLKRLGLIEHRKDV